MSSKVAPNEPAERKSMQSRSKIYPDRARSNPDRGQIDQDRVSQVDAGRSGRQIDSAKAMQGEIGLADRVLPPEAPQAGKLDKLDKRFTVISI